MQEALVLAEEAGRLGDVPVGCVIVRGDEIVGRGANEIQRMGDPTRHAEIVAIEQAVRTIGAKFLDECTLYVTLEPCSMSQLIPKQVHAVASSRCSMILG